MGAPRGALVASCLALMACGKLATGAGDAAPDADVSDAPTVGSDAPVPPPCGTCGNPCGDPPFVTMGAPRVEPNACTQQEIQDFVTACDSSLASSTTCDAWQSQNDGGTCGACVGLVPETATMWGPYACASSSEPCRLNSGGCVDVVRGAMSSETNAGGAGSCGDDVTQRFVCEDFECGDCADPTSFDSCVAGADKTTCNSPLQATTACIGDAGTAIERCFPQSDEDIVTFVSIFCGAGP